MKVFYAIGLLALGCLLAGCYGAIHNQISYSVSPEYFTKFKFEQFGVSRHLDDRIGAALVGWQASWWMGIAIGTFVIPFAFLLRTNRTFVRGVLRAFVVVLATTMTSGLLALMIAIVSIHPDPTRPWQFRGVLIEDPAAFRRAGAMHNFSYAGGLMGIFAGLASVHHSFMRENQSLAVVQDDRLNGTEPRS